MKADWPSEEAYRRAAETLRCDVAAIKAVAEVEAGPQGAFLPSGEPVALYEAHLFDRFTKGRYRGSVAPDVDPRHAELSYPRWQMGTYGPISVQHRKLAAAAELDREAALRAASWGLFQILGDNYRAAGFETLQEFVNAMYRSADDHLAALTAFIQNDRRLLSAIRSCNWPGFSAIYNGPGYKKNRHDVKLAAAYARHAALG